MVSKLVKQRHMLFVMFGRSRWPLPPNKGQCLIAPMYLASLIAIVPEKSEAGKRPSAGDQRPSCSPRDEARRIAANIAIAKLPELSRKS
jgi:hypothetical protein